MPPPSYLLLTPTGNVFSQIFLETSYCCVFDARAIFINFWRGLIIENFGKISQTRDLCIFHANGLFTDFS